MLKRLLTYLFTAFFAVVLLLLATNLLVVLSTTKLIYQELRDVPEQDVALVLGTSKRFADGSPNTYFENRMNAAAQLYKEGKIKHLILSGDNRTKYYNEPLDMQKALIKRGIPQEATTLDYAGLRTLDSVVRSKEIFGQQRVVIITQRFHAYRALYIAEYYRMNAVAYAANELPFRSSVNLQLREILARPMALLDLYVFKKAPKHLGEQEPLNISG
jgi:SanA protein